MPVHPSEILCTHVHGLQVTVAVGLEGELLGRKELGLPIPTSAAGSGSSKDCGGSSKCRSFYSGSTSSNDWCFFRKPYQYSLVLSILRGKEVPGRHQGIFSYAELF